MTEEDSGESVPGKIRPALSDLTNRKRGGASSGEEESSGGQFSKRLCVVVDDLVKQHVSSSDSKCSSEEEKGSRGEVSSGEDAKPLKEIYFEPGDRDGARELSGSDVEMRKEFGRCKNVRAFEMSRCSNVDKEEGVDDDGLIKSCSCSFCLKAAYIWSDLHYQDIKGRLSALKKSQKVASSLIQRNDKEKTTGFHGFVSSVGSAKLESDLMGQWRSLFLSMGDILAHESNHLQNSFTTMKDLREDCKIDLERATKTPQHKT
ncbi:unnamed protein product [Eruca vesicaria subsp. sativa]|uniref:Uncharacterized protein n=1 Tax=Eruca vesicaria subsp. sativa TaxID=29727 RepID=A0ABC8K5S2_ERUVS|nr:unnamed protein product [Eruca vesicaria subsp. sativa]